MELSTAIRWFSRRGQCIARRAFSIFLLGVHVSLGRDGFEVLEGVLSVKEVECLLGSLSQLKLEPRRGWVRNIESRCKEVAELVAAEPLMRIARQHLAGVPKLVRAIYFDKSAERNWSVTWHQDRTVAVSGRFAMDGWGPWSSKAGIWHVQPPIAVLEDMLTVRLHLDPTDAGNGCLKIAAGSHLLGLVPSANASAAVEQNSVVYCEVPLGAAVVMRPHVLHASEKSITNAARRVLHFEYSSYRLPEGIAWAG